jgi:hypothetical protein
MESENLYECRICYAGEEEGQLIKPCKCSGTMKFVHIKCLEIWRATGPKEATSCPQCKYQYKLGLVKTANTGGSWPIPSIQSSAWTILSIFWFVCAAGYLVHIFSGRVEDWEITFPIYPSEMKFGIGSYLALGLPIMGIMGMSFSSLLHGYGSLVRLQLQRTEGLFSAFVVITFHVFLAMGFVGVVLACTQERTCRPTRRVRTNTRTYVLDTRDAQ